MFLITTVWYIDTISVMFSFILIECVFEYFVHCYIFSENILKKELSNRGRFLYEEKNHLPPLNFIPDVLLKF